MTVFASAGAQAGQAQAADECAAQPTPADEIACLRRALKEKTDALARTQPGAPAAATGRVAQPAAPQPAAPASIKAADQPVQASRAGQGAPRAVAAANPADELGREQIASSRKRDKQDNDAPAKSTGLQAVVLSAKEDREGLFRLTLENGQVWKQSDRPSIQIALRNEQKYAVEIAESGFGGYRMYFPDLRRTIVVKRIL